MFIIGLVSVFPAAFRFLLFTSPVWVDPWINFNSRWEKVRFSSLRSDPLLISINSRSRTCLLCTRTIITSGNLLPSLKHAKIHRLLLEPKPKATILRVLYVRKLRSNTIYLFINLLWICRCNPTILYYLFVSFLIQFLDEILYKISRHLPSYFTLERQVS